MQKSQKNITFCCHTKCQFHCPWLYLEPLRDRVACQLKIGLKDEAGFNSGRKRRKRNAKSSSEPSSRTSTTLSRTNRSRSIDSTKSIYGCPPGFQKASEYLCLHLSRNSTGHTNKHTFSQSKFYCESKGHGANVVSISNQGDALALWKWISNHFLPL